MKPSELRALLEACDGSPAALRELARELGRCLRASDERRDPLGVFILETRKRYRMTPRADNNKSGKSTREYMGRKYYEAARSGYMGSFEQW